MRMRKRNIIVMTAALLCLAVAFGGCAKSTGKSYTKSEARTAQSVQRGVIVSIDEVTIEQDASIAGVGLGGAAGGVIGSTLGRGTGRVLATVAGAAIGAVAGAAGEKALRTEKAYEFTIELDGGGTISVVQAIDGTYQRGDRVRVLRGAGNRARVVLDR